MKELTRVRKKIQHHVGRQWCGYLTAMDVLTLRRGGAKFAENDLIHANAQKAEGDGTPRWRFFEVPDVWKV